MCKGTGKGEVLERAPLLQAPGGQWGNEEHQPVFRAAVGRLRNSNAGLGKSATAVGMENNGDKGMNSVSRPQL